MRTRLHRVFFAILLSLSPMLAARAPRLLAGPRFSAMTPATFTFTLPTGASARIAVDQGETDLVLKLLGPGDVVRVVDGFSSGVETMTISLSPGGAYALEVSSRERKPVKFSVLLSVPAAGPNPADWSQAEDLATGAKRLAGDPAAKSQALNAIRQSLDAWARVGATAVMARTHLKAGDFYFRDGDWAQAKTEYRAAIELCPADCDLRSFAEGLNNASLAALNLSQIDEAEAGFQAALPSWDRLRLSTMAARTSSNLGVLYRRTGEWQLALKWYERARQLNSNASSLSYAQTLNNLGLVYSSLGSYEEASVYFRKALRIAVHQPDSAAAAARMHINLGRSLLMTEHLAEALEQMQMALNVFLPLGNASGTAEAQNNLGQVLVRLRRQDEARASLAHALGLYRQIKDARGESSALHYLGVLAAGRDLDAARNLLREALKIRERRGLRDEAAETAYQLAIVEQKTGHRDEALRYIEQALAATEKLRMRVAGQSFRQSYFAVKRNYWEFYISCLLDATPDATRQDREQAVAAAFQVAERARARSLADILQEGQLLLRKADPASLAQQHSLRRRANFLSDRLAALADTPSNEHTAAGLRGEIAELMAEEAEVESLIESQNPGYNGDANPPAVTLADLQRDLAPDDLVLEYSLGEEHSYLWTISRGSAVVTTLPPRSEIAKDVRVLISALNDIHGRQGDPRKRAAWASLTGRLAERLQLRFEANSAAARIAIIPDGVLQRVPFAILPARFGEGPRAHTAPLGLRVELLQAPSAAVLRILTARQMRAAARPLSITAFGDPVYSGEDARVEIHPPGSAHADWNKAPMRLGFSQIELEAVERLFPASRRTVLRGFAANKPALFGELVTRHSLLLLSAHASADDRQPPLSRIMLSTVSEKGRPVDGVVHLYDLYDRLHLDSQFVVVSACEVANGRVVSGEGLIGLFRGFLQAGASGLLGSPVEVDSEASAHLTSAFLEALIRRPQSPAHALFEARRNLAASSRWKDPFYWGSFILISGFEGEPAAISQAVR